MKPGEPGGANSEVTLREVIYIGPVDAAVLDREGLDQVGISDRTEPDPWLAFISQLLKPPDLVLVHDGFGSGGRIPEIDEFEVLRSVELVLQAQDVLDELGDLQALVDRNRSVLQRHD